MRAYIPAFELVAPTAPEEVLALLASGEWRPFAGGTDLMVLAEADKLSHRRWVSVLHLAELRGVAVTADAVVLGAATTYTEVRRHPLLRAEFPLLCRAAAETGGIAIQNRGTLGGNLANASPAADTVPPLYAADAVVELVSVSSRREVPVDRFFTGPRRSVLAPDELIVGVRIPRREGVRGAFLRLGQRRAQAISKVSVAVGLAFKDGAPAWVRVALGAVAPTVVRAPRAEKILLAGGPEALREARAAVMEEIAPIDDLRSTREYRRQMAGVLLERAVRKASEA